MRRAICRHAAESGRAFAVASAAATAIAIAIAIAPIAPIAAAALAAPPPPPSTPTLLALTPGVEGRDLAALLDRLEAAGVEVPIAIAGAGLLLREPAASGPASEADLAAVLAGEPSIRRVVRGPIAADELLPKGAAPSAAGLVRWWNGRFEEGDASPAPPRPARPRPEPAAPGMANVAPRICAGVETVEAARRSRRAARAGDDCENLLEYGRIHFAAGRIVVNLLFPEHASRPWEYGRIEDATARIARATNWWNLQSEGRATFVIVDHGRVSTDRDPSLVAYEDERFYLADCMTSLGFPAGACAYESIDRLNTSMSDSLGAHWGFTQVVLNQGSFPGLDGALAYAYLGGPLTVALSEFDGQPSDILPKALAQVVAHEMGHIFQALDEYAGGCFCSRRSGYLHVANGGCVDCIASPQFGCIMRTISEYDDEDRADMENRILPCTFTRGQTGLRDEDPEDGVLDVMQTDPETEISAAPPDTLVGSEGLALTGVAWDRPYAFAPPSYDAVTINAIGGVEYRIDGTAWRPADPLDGLFDDREEGWKLRLPALGGGSHRLEVRGVNTVSRPDPTPEEADLFVYDVKLLHDLTIATAGERIVLAWTIDGEDFGGEYVVERRRSGAPASEIVARIASQGGRDDRFVWADAQVVAGEDYAYTLEVEIPGRARKLLGGGRETAVLGLPPPGRIVTAGPNPTRGTVLFTVTVPEDGAPRGSAPDARAGGPEARSSPNRDVRMAIHDSSGRRVRDFGHEQRPGGARFNRRWDGRDDLGGRVASGIYFFSVELDGVRDDAKFVVVRLLRASGKRPLS